DPRPDPRHRRRLRRPATPSTEGWARRPATPRGGWARAGARRSRVDLDATVGVPAVLLGDDRVDPFGGPFDLAGLVGDHVVVVLLAGQLDRGVALAQLELVGGLRGTASKALEEVLERRRDDEDEQRPRDLLLDHLCALDVDLEDDVPTLRQPLADLAARRAIPVLVVLGCLQ